MNIMHIRRLAAAMIVVLVLVAGCKITTHNDGEIWFEHSSRFGVGSSAADTGSEAWSASDWQPLIDYIIRLSELKEVDQSDHSVREPGVVSVPREPIE